MAKPHDLARRAAARLAEAKAGAHDDTYGDEDVERHHKLDRGMAGEHVTFHDVSGKRHRGVVQGSRDHEGYPSSYVVHRKVGGTTHVHHVSTYDIHKTHGGGGKVEPAPKGSPVHRQPF